MKITQNCMFVFQNTHTKYPLRFDWRLTLRTWSLKYTNFDSHFKYEIIIWGFVLYREFRLMRSLDFLCWIEMSHCLWKYRPFSTSTDTISRALQNNTFNKRFENSMLKVLIRCVEWALFSRKAPTRLITLSISS